MHGKCLIRLILAVVVFQVATVEGVIPDFDNNRTVDYDDFPLFSDAFGLPVEDAGAEFDLNSDGRIDLADFFQFADQFGAQSSVALQSAHSAAKEASFCASILTSRRWAIWPCFLMEWYSRQVAYKGKEGSSVRSCLPPLEAETSRLSLVLIPHGLSM
jgi:hypothetical protein